MPADVTSEWKGRRFVPLCPGILSPCRQDQAEGSGQEPVGVWEAGVLLALGHGCPHQPGRGPAWTRILGRLQQVAPLSLVGCHAWVFHRQTVRPPGQQSPTLGCSLTENLWLSKTVPWGDGGLKYCSLPVKSQVIISVQSYSFIATVIHTDSHKKEEKWHGENGF